MIRPATRADLPGILAVRDGAGEDRLSDPRLVSAALACRWVDTGALWVWQDAGGAIAGFAAVDADAGAILALLVAPSQAGRGIGRALLAAACEALRAASHATAMLGIEPGTRAERHYRAAGWTDGGTDERGMLVLRKPL